MENESKISLGRTIILHTEALISGGGGGGDSVRFYLGQKCIPFYKKGIKKSQNKSMETTVKSDIKNLCIKTTKRSHTTKLI